MIDPARRSWGGFAALAALIALGWLVSAGPLAGTAMPHEPQAALAGGGQVVGDR